MAAVSHSAGYRVLGAAIQATHSGGGNSAWEGLYFSHKQIFAL